MYVTGHGLKTLDAVADHVGPTATIAADARRVPRGVPERARRSDVAVTVRIPTQLRSSRAAHAEVIVEGATVSEALKALDAAHPGFGERLYDESGGLRRFVNVFVADEDIRFLDGVDTAVTDGADVSIVPAVAGG